MPNRPRYILVIRENGITYRVSHEALSFEKMKEFYRVHLSKGPILGLDIFLQRLKLGEEARWKVNMDMRRKMRVGLGIDL